MDAQLWDRLSPTFQRRLKWVLWFVTWIVLLVGLYDRVFFEYAVWISVAHAALFLVLFGFRPMVFPVQLRLLYVAWVALGTFVPQLIVLMYITIVGLPANLFFGYCPLARMMYLLPWNRDEPLTPGLVKHIFLTPPVQGRFRPDAATRG